MRRPKSEPVTPTSLRLPNELKRRLQKVAKERMQPLTWLMIFALDEWEKAYVKKQDWDKRERELQRINR